VRSPHEVVDDDGNAVLLGVLRPRCVAIATRVRSNTAGLLPASATGNASPFDSTVLVTASRPSALAACAAAWSIEREAVDGVSNARRQ
jgi:hypothetical protein